ncbi:Uu.00g060380.m01.CDS01 [Anthostomella pinea]|uniref:Uu.00g060380.m01.CDS01 n=1 Tax=Anthostomella pinea TaxID=933095 RepID=A0AAI8VT26_9PEZI|nr:Uu.00g060380.m01.CDS01 [Anthostomella pinea]
MSSTNPKANSRSRFSSPIHLSSSPSSHNRGTAATDGQRSFMRTWLEPPVQNKASFQADGLVRGGVVENMAPLGTLPKVLKKQAAAAASAAIGGGGAANGAGAGAGAGAAESLPASSGVKRIVLKKPTATAAATPPESVPMSTTELPEATTASAAADVPLSPLSRPFSNSILDNGEDEEYVPKKTTHSKARRHSSHNNTIVPNNTGTPTSTRRTVSSRRKSARPSPAPIQAPMPPAPFQAPPSTRTRAPTDKDLVDKVIEFAVDEALRHYRYPTAYALRQLYDDYSSDPSFVLMIEDVFKQEADVETLEEFSRLLYDKKKEGKKEDKGCHYFVPPPTGTHFTPPKPKPAPYGELLKMDLDTPLKPLKSLAGAIDLDGHVSKKIKTDAGDVHALPNRDASAITDANTYAVLPVPVQVADAEMADAAPVAAPVAEATAGPNAQAIAQATVEATAQVTAKAAAKMTATPTPTPTPTPAPTSTHTHTPVTNGNGSGHGNENGVEVGTHGRVRVASHKSSPHRSPQKTQKTHKSHKSHKSHVSHKGAHKSPRKSHHKSPRKKHRRSGSMSSTSSGLSSLPDGIDDDYESFMERVDDDLGVSRPLASEPNEPNEGQIPAVSAQPISGPQKKSAAKRKNVSPSPASARNTPSQHRPDRPSRDSSMPAAIIANGASHPPATESAASLKFNSRFGQLPDSTSIARRKLEKRYENSRITKEASGESFVRDPPEVDELEELPEDAPFLSLPPPPPEHIRSSRQAALTGRAARAAKRHHDDLDDSISPTTSSFRADLEPLSTRNSRAATPSNLRSTKKPRTGLRVKTSPMKKKGTSAGIPRSNNNERPSPVGFGGPGNQYNDANKLCQDLNDDTCFSCSGSGELVLCDGCSYSFHFLCIDPPMDPGDIPNEWYCNECNSRYYPPPGAEHRGVFGSLETNLDRNNPRAFRLPEDIRDHFEGVKTGPEGEYEEITTTSTKPKTNKKNLEEPYDFYKVKNNDGPVLCHICHKGSSGNRAIIPCSVCKLHWHLECLDPPLALPPVLRTWRCPCHVEEMLSSIPARLAPAHRYRKIKNAPVIEQSYSRGMANNGWIEIEEDDDDDESPHVWREQESFGRVFRVSAKGIKEDFISRVRQNQAKAQARAGATNPASAVAPRVRSLEEQQAALNLSLLSQSGGGGDGVQPLIDAMLSEASPAVRSMIARGDAQNMVSGDLSKADNAALEAMMAQVDIVKQRIATILEGRGATFPHGASNVGSHDDSMSSQHTVDDETRAHVVSGSAMQLD